MADHVALVINLIVDRPSCLRCIAVKSSMTPLALDQVVRTIATVLVLNRVTDRCRVCGTTGTVLYVDRPQSQSPRPDATRGNTGG
jgi:hypothetical protein